MEPYVSIIVVVVVVVVVCIAWDGNIAQMVNGDAAICRWYSFKKL
jgi:hypothetical protein